VEFIVPAGTAVAPTPKWRGSSRGIIAKNKLMKQPMVVINKAGGAGAEALSMSRDSKGDPEQADRHPLRIFSRRRLLRTRLSTGENMTPVQMMALDNFVLWVKRGKRLTKLPRIRCRGPREPA